MTNCNSCGGTTVFISGSIVKCEYCGRLYSTSNGELNVADPERLYSSAVSMSKSRNEDTLKSAIETFEALGSYKDSSTLANSCKGMIAQSRVEAEERRLAAERQAELERIESEKRAFEEKQKAKIRRIVIAAVSAVAVIAVAISVIGSSNKSSSYNKAMELYSTGQYEEALEVFNSLGDYSDAATYVSTINNFLAERESKYEKGVGYYEKGAYSECITSLTDISGYLDSADYIEKSVEAIYQQATEFYDVGEFEKAKELLGKIPDSSSKNMDAELLLSDIEEIIIEQTNAANYEQAKEYYDNGDYETAQRLFISLGNYEDSAMYLSSIGDNYYKRAQELYNAGDYAGCGEQLMYIDTVEEWIEYAVAAELKQTVSVAYINMVSEEAKRIAQKDGKSAMFTYVDSMLCNIFSQNNADDIKDKYQEWQPKELSEITMIDTDFWGSLDSVGTATDLYQNAYESAFSYRMSGNATIEENYQLFLLNGEYQQFSATLSPAEKWKNDRKVTIAFYGDDVKIEQFTIDRKTSPLEIEIDVTGVNELKICFQAEKDLTYSVVYFIIANPFLYR